MKLLVDFFSKEEVFCKIINYFVLYFILLLCISCKGLIQIDPPVNNLSEDNIFSSNASAASSMTGIYAKMSNNNRSSFISNGVTTNISLVAALSADELQLFGQGSGFLLAAYTNSLKSSDSPGYWDDFYRTIFSINSAIIALQNNSSISLSVKNQLLGEAKFLRAWCYFYLVNIYGDIPLVLNTDPFVNAILNRTPVEDVYTQIISDLNDSKDLLSSQFLSANLTTVSLDRVRPTKWAALSLLAKVYLYKKDFINSEKMSTAVIDSSTLFHLESLNRVFIKSSTEAIWQLQCTTTTEANTGEGQFFILPKEGPNGFTYPVFLSDYVMNTFESGDMRKAEWVGVWTNDSISYTYYPYKYKSGRLNDKNVTTEYSMVIRLGEVYLMRAEARAQLGKISGSELDLNSIRSRANLHDVHDLEKNALIDTIMHERRVELFTEWGNRWFDLKRTKTVDSVMSIVTHGKGGIWSTNWQYYPISNSELNANIFLKQNEGY